MAGSTSETAASHAPSKTDTAQKNEVPLKLLCHNIVVVHRAVADLGIEPVFADVPTGNAPKPTPIAVAPVDDIDRSDFRFSD